MEYEEVEKFLDELYETVRDFSYYVLDITNSVYDDETKCDEKVISTLETLEGLLSLKIGMKIINLKSELKQKIKAKGDSEC